MCDPSRYALRAVNKLNLGPKCRAQFVFKQRKMRAGKNDCIDPFTFRHVPQSSRCSFDHTDVDGFSAQLCFGRFDDVGSGQEKQCGCNLEEILHSDSL